MDINYFEQIWSKKKTDKIASQVFWNSRAEEFNQKVYTGEGEERLNRILTLFTSKGMMTSESKVLDIGCGPGKYAMEFAKKAKTVTGIDVSSKMIEYSKGNALRKGLSNARFEVLDWEELDINYLEWDKKFDLVFASMCPAINSKATLEKLVNASCGYCFLSNFVERRDEVKDYLSKNIVWQNAKGGYGKTIYCSFNILWLMGFHPEITYIDTAWENVIPLDKATDFYCSYFEMTQKVSSQQKDFIQSHLEKIAENGIVKETVQAKIAWMYWKV